MNKVKLHTLWLLGMLFLMTACGDDDDYYYPSVKLEFVTVKAGADGLIQSLLPDKGELYCCERPYRINHFSKLGQACDQ